MQFYALIAVSFMSTFAKYYRENICENFQIDPVMLKVKELQNKYNLAKTTDEDLARQEEEHQEHKREKQQNKDRKKRIMKEFESQARFDEDPLRKRQ